MQSWHNVRIVSVPAFRFVCYHNLGHEVAQLVESLCYKPEGHGFDSRWGH